MTYSLVQQIHNSKPLISIKSRNLTNDQNTPKGSNV
jgi:hypothetical protein